MEAPTATREQLVGSLRDVGKEPVQLTAVGGETLLMLPYGGRILGLFSGPSSRNFLWTHSALADPQTARELYDSERWHNSGGDRTWLAPELDFFYPAFPDTSRYVQPRQFDAGSFNVDASDAEITLRTEFALRSFRARADAKLALVKSVCLVDDPLRKDPASQAPAELEFAGFRLRTSLEALTPLPRNFWVGIWNLLQLPGGGELFAPTYYRTEPTIFFGDIPPDHLHVGDRVIRYRMEAPGEQKICISALATTGRLGYLHAEGDQSVLIVRSFAVDPTGAYRDVWFTKPADDGYAVQACNINTSSLGCFAEMEYHAPAIGGNTRCDRADDVSFVWAYRGESAAIREAAKLLLGVDV